MQSKIAADDTFIVFLFPFEDKIRLGVLCESSAKQRIHMTYQALFSLKNNSKYSKIVCCNRDWRLKGYFNLAKWRKIYEGIVNITIADILAIVYNLTQAEDFVLIKNMGKLLMRRISQCIEI